ncbi:MAG: hypothetical protein Q9221_001211 [Calogaya cf. arnoldii]
MDHKHPAPERGQGLHPRPSSQHVSRSTSPVSPSMKLAHDDLLHLPDDNNSSRNIHIHLTLDEQHGLHSHLSSQHASRSTSPVSPSMKLAPDNLPPYSNDNNSSRDIHIHLALDDQHGLHPHPSSQHTSRSTSPISPSMTLAHNNVSPSANDNTTKALYSTLSLSAYGSRITRAIDPYNIHPQYTFEYHSGSPFSTSPHITITKTQNTSKSTPAAVGTVKFHHLTREIDIAVHGKMVSMDLEGNFRSLALRQLLSWETEDVWSKEMVLSNARKQFIAKLDSSFTRWKLIISNDVINEGALDEIVVSGCAFHEYTRRLRSKIDGPMDGKPDPDRSNPLLGLGLSDGGKR